MEKEKEITATFNNKDDLAEAYMPFVLKNGIFIASEGEYDLHETIIVTLLLPSQEDPLIFSGKIIWITPRTAINNKKPGIGVQLIGVNGSAACQKIEELIGSHLSEDQQTNTL